jgi:hypothetical protein
MSRSVPRLRPEVVHMFFWIVLAVISLFLAWAAWVLRGRDMSRGPDAAAERHRRTDGYGGGGG